MDCEVTRRQVIDDSLNELLSNQYGNREPIYFIKLKNEDTIQKMYQGGGFKEESVDTDGERMVVEMLRGNKDPFAYPQYNCCGGDDIIPEIPFSSFFLPERRYLKDFPSEIEHILLVRNDNNEILGGVVYLYGD